MSRIPPHHVGDVPVSLEVRNQLISAVCSTRFKKEEWEIAAEAIEEWTRRHNPDAIALPATKGYQWKSLFLPDGTLLRTVFGGKNFHCIVEADAIVYDGKPVSPSGFVNAVGGIGRNAWRCTWVLLPQTDQWKLADTLRTRLRPPRRPAPARPAQHDRPMRESAAPAPAAVTAPDPFPEQKETTLTSATSQRGSQQAADHQSPRLESKQDGLSGRQRGAASLSPSQCARRGERRAMGDEQTRSLVWAELLPALLPLLNRICATDAGRGSTGPSPGH